MYFIAETKWDKEAEGLNDDEHIKIKCATKHFEAINQSVNEVVKYTWVKKPQRGSHSHRCLLMTDTKTH